MSFSMTRMKLEATMLSEISKEKDKYWMMSLICRVQKEKKKKIEIVKKNGGRMVVARSWG